MDPEGPSNTSLNRICKCMLRTFLWMGGFSMVTVIVLVIILYVPDSGIYVTIGVVVLVILICVCAYKQPQFPCVKKKAPDLFSDNYVVDPQQQSALVTEGGGQEQLALAEGEIELGIGKNEVNNQQQLVYANQNYQQPVPVNNGVNCHMVPVPPVVPGAAGGHYQQVSGHYQQVPPGHYNGRVGQVDEYEYEAEPSAEYVDDSQDVDDVLGALCYIAI